eukprot:XP_011430338.1 PREDICTED: uncharacterized protein LOC105330389 [Crassostrea gigas]
MEASVIIQILCTLWFCLTILTEGQISGKLETQFKNPLGNFPLLNIEIDHQTGNVFVSGMNVLYRFSMDGTKLIQKVAKKTGPEANCLTPEDKEYCKDYNTVMVVTPNSLITCGTLKGGLCLTRDKESLNITITSPSIRLVSNEQASAVGIFLKIRDRSSSGSFENIVLFAKQYTTLPLGESTFGTVAIFSALPDLSAVNIGSSKFGKIFDMILKTPRNVVMDYRVVIENDKFVFLLVNQDSQSKLVKICKSIDIAPVDPKKVYEDIPISCNSEGTNLTHVKHGTFISASGKKYLVGLFSSLNPTLSAVCVFEENEIYQRFLTSRKHRYGCPEHNLPKKDRIFLGDKGELKCANTTVDKNDQVCIICSQTKQAF